MPRVNPGRPCPSDDGPASPGRWRAARRLAITPPARGRCECHGPPVRMGRASCPPAAASPPMNMWGGFGGREQTLWPPLRGPRVGFAPPPAPRSPGGAGGGRGAARPSSPARSRVGPSPSASASKPRGPGPPRATPAPAFRRAAPARPFRAGPGLARAPRPRPARAAAGRPWPSVRGLHRAASMRPVRLIIHIFTAPEIPYFTGFSSRQARCFLVQ